MKKRIFILFSLLLFRFILGYVDTLKFETNRGIAVSGIIYKTYQNDNKCIMYVGKFILQSEGICSVFKSNKIRAVGTVGSEVITRLMGRISLDDAKIYRLDKTEKNDNSCGYFCTFINNFRESLLTTIRKNVPDPESGLIAGIVLGYKKDIGPKFYQELVKSGTIHIAVASGYNVLLVGGTILSVCFWMMKRKWATVVAILLMFFYVLIAGGDPPVVRAWIMASLILVVQAMGRANTSWWILCLAIWTMLIWEPYLLLDVSFQLSVMASFGMIVLEPWLNRNLKTITGEGMLEFLSGVGVITSVATLMMTAPVIWWHFGRMTWVGVLSNLLVLPFVPFLMMLASLMFIFGGIMSIPVYVVAHFVVLVIRFLGA